MQGEVCRTEKKKKERRKELENTLLKFDVRSSYDVEFDLGWERPGWERPVAVAVKANCVCGIVSDVEGYLGGQGGEQVLEFP